MENDSLDVVVVGGGLCGLATAAEILRLTPGARLLCLEANGRPGGVIRTARLPGPDENDGADAGFVVDFGPAGFLDRTGAVRRLAGALGLEGDLIASSDAQRVRWVKRGGRLHRFPTTIRDLLRSDLLSARGKLSFLCEPLRPAPPVDEQRDETVRAFATRRLGREAAEVLIDPIVSGIYAADAGQVSVEASLPQLAALERQGRSLLRSLLGATGSVRPLVSFRGGVQRLIDALAGSLGERVLCGAPVESITRRQDHYEVRIGGARPQTLRCRAIASAAPAHAAATYFKGLDPELAWQLAQVRYASVAVAALAYRRADIRDPLSGFGYLVPRCETSPVLGVQWSSSMYPGVLAPQGTCLVRLFLGGAYNPTLASEPVEALGAIARREIEATLGATAAPLFCQVERHIHAMPQYLPDHHGRVAAIERRLHAHPGLFVGGNGLRGLGMDAVVHDGEKQAEAIAQFLAASVRLDQPQTEAEVRTS